MLLVKNSAQLQQLIPALPRVHVTSCWWGNEAVCWTCSTTEQHRFSTVHTVWNHCGTPGASLHASSHLCNPALIISVCFQECGRNFTRPEKSQEVKEVQHIWKEMERKACTVIALLKTLEVARP